LLGESDYEDDDGQLESLGAFVDSLASKTEKPTVETPSEATKSNVEGYSCLNH